MCPDEPYPAAAEAFPRLRQSLLSAFDRCSLQAKFSIDHEHDWSTHDQARGQLFHRVAARCLEDMAASGERSVPVEVAVAAMEDELRQAHVDRECPRCFVERPENVGGGRHRCGECGKEWMTGMVAIPAEQIAQLRTSVITWAAYTSYDIQHLASVEERLRARVSYPSPAGGVVDREITGALDALFLEPDGRAVVLDWKDTWAIPPATEVSFGGYFQQRFYALLVMDNYRSVQSVTLREFYPRYASGKVSARNPSGMPAREATVSRGDLEDVRAELAALAERFDRSFVEDLWRPSPGKHCSYCPRPTACPIFPDARGEGAIADAEQARRYAAEAAVAKAAYDQRMEQLKVWSNVNGAVPISDAKGRRAYGYVQTTRTTKPDKETLARALREAAGDVPIDLDRLYVTTDGTRYEAHVPAESPAPTPEDARLAEQLRRSLEGRDAA